MEWLGDLVTLPHILLARLVAERLEKLFDCCLAPHTVTAGVRADTGRSYTESTVSSSTCGTELEAVR